MLFLEMDYPTSPFNDNFNTKILVKLHTDDTVGQVQLTEDLKLKKLLKWLCSPPKLSSYRINSITHSTKDIFIQMKHYMSNIPNNTINIQLCSYLPDVIILHNANITHLDLVVKPLEVIVDVHCAAAVLRGANIFAPGIMGMQSGINNGDLVSIYADIGNNCRRGLQKMFNFRKVFIGNGIAKMRRSQLFGKNSPPNGVAVEVYSSISGCVTPNIDSLLKGSCLLQNLPSIICTHVLNPQPGETILDMCASPGNKTTHIAALMKSEGILIAVDKTVSKINQLKETCATFNANVLIFQADSTKIFSNDVKRGSCSVSGPPFGRECFDRILLDAPCSALGKRPQLYNNISEKVLKSYIPLQRKLFENAVHLLKVNGYLVYSTCTITLAENEGLVAWALNTFKCLKLYKGKPHLGGNGWKVHGLSDIDLECVQRFGPDCMIDSVGFFIACFTKEVSV